jgi:large subunit ribosomal protein L4
MSPAPKPARREEAARPEGAGRTEGTPSGTEVRTFDAHSGASGTLTLDAARLQPASARAPRRGFHPVVLRDAVIMYEANRRVGTVQTKSRHFVSGTTKKMYKQKHTGNARQGDGKAPHFRGGGVCFGPHPRDFSYAMPKRALSRALAVALASKIRDGEVTVVSGLALSAPSTKAYAKFLTGAEAGHKALLVTAASADRNLLLSSRNVPGARVLPASEVNARDVVACSRLLLAEGAYEALVARIGRFGASR